ncbi:UDP-glucuronosyltransferase 1-8 [Orchesella cincta]|uniref:UDP-glucuronosyltransferase 1-8 n=1 Tax=Orchesella cincta TaxID=48709 RepID=A0A1D2MBN9_ORCCI|nr:UDP-glucuronosyltransferase 1-8 [Orchesella cincta]
MKTTSPKLLLIISAQLFACAPILEGSNILFYHGIATSSHRTAIWPLASKLADMGHNLTYIFPVIKKIGSHPQIEEIIPSKLVPLLAEYVSDFDINIRINNKTSEWTMSVFSRALEFCEAFYDSPEIQEWLHRPDLHYDLVFIDASLGDCGYGLVHKFKAKHILFYSSVLPYMFDAFGVVPETSSIPEFYFHKKPSDMSFLNRVVTTLSPFIFRYNVIEFGKTLHKVLLKKMNLTELPTLMEFQRNTSLVFLNHHFIEEYPISLPPMFISYSGLWCHKEMTVNPLPEKFENFIRDSEGFVYVSFGTAVVASGMPESLRAKFFKAFEAFPDIKFLWRWTGSIPENTPSNVMLYPWFPQKDVLAHPKIKGFITQAGRPSIQEALCRGVKMISIPIMADQNYNADRLEYIGASINLNIDIITETNLRSAIDEVLHNPKFTDKLRELSEMYKDRSVDPLENAVYWTNYVLKYDTSLLKPLGMTQTWYERRLLDVYGFLLLVSLLLVVLLTFLAVLVYRCTLRIVFQPKIKLE